MLKLPFLLLAGGFVICALAGISGWILAPIFIKNNISEEGVSRKLTEDSETWVHWQASLTEIYIKVYLFNITNPNEVLLGETPNLTEIGPFVYREQRSKTIIKVNKENDTIKYKEKIEYYFQPKLSSGTEQDVVTVTNLPFVGLARQISNFSPIIRYMVNSYINRFNETIFIQRTVAQLIFEGYYQPMIASLSALTGTEYLHNNTFGLYYGKNGTDTGIYEVYTGIQNASQFGQIATWNGKQDLKWWQDEHCKRIVGTESFTFPPFLTRSTTLYTFSADLCRPLYLKYQKDIEYDGIPGYRFVVPKEVFQDPRINQENLCYCTNHDEDYQGCPKDGAYQISSCNKDAPILVSMPHFMYGPEYSRLCTGLHPNPERHEYFIDVEPNTGLVLHAAKRIQINVEMIPLQFTKSLKKVPHVLMPFMWEEEMATISKSEKEKLSSTLATPLLAAKVCAWIGVSFGAVLVLIAFTVFAARTRRKKYFS